MNRVANILLTALAPTVWGSTYIITTELLPQGYPLTAGALRALPAGLLLLLISRQLPKGGWWWKIFVLGALNFAVFFWLLFEAAYRLPGGIAATLGAIQPLIVIFASYIVLGTAVRMISILASLAGIAGVALLVLSPQEVFDPIGVLAGLGGALSMALGIVMTRKWQPPVSTLTFTAWQLIAGGLLLLPAVLVFERDIPVLTTGNLAGYLYLGVVGGAFAYMLWFRGIALLGPNTVSPLSFLSPATAVILGWGLLNQQLGVWQIIGVITVLVSIRIATKHASGGQG